MLELLDPVTHYANEVLAGRIVAGPYVRLSCKRHLDDLHTGHKRGIYFDYAEMFRVFRFFENNLKLSEGKHEGLPFKLHISQKFIIGSLFGWRYIKNKKRRFKRCYIEMGKGNGKALALDTPIATPDGFKSMGELQVGDYVIGDDGKPTRILKTSEVMYNRECYAVTFSDGETIIADAEHLWKVNGEIVTTETILFNLSFVNLPLCVDHRHVVNCTPVPSVPVKCISVDNQSKMFLCGRTLIPTHNSPLAGGIGLFGMLADNEPGAQIYSAGADRNQSGILFQDAVKMAKSSPVINKLITYSGNANIFNMACLKRKQAGSFFRPLARTAGKTGSGPRPHMALIDELHEHPGRDVMDGLERGFKAREQPLLFIITNSGSDRNSICYEERMHAIKVVEGEYQDDRTFSYVCALDPKDDPLEDPGCWIKANPLLGVILTPEYLAEQVKQAKMIPGKANGIKRLHFCVWTNSVNAWISREAWEAIEDPTMQLSDFVGKRCHAGLDLSARKDLTAKALIFEDGWTELTEKDGETVLPRPKYAMFVHGYTPKDTLEDRVKTDKAPYDVWVQQGFLTATPGPVIDLKFVIFDLIKDRMFFKLENVAYDAFLITRFLEDLNDMNEELPLIEHPQGYGKRQDTPLWMPESISTLETLILEKRLRVHVNHALRSAVAGATFEVSPADLKRFTKQKATTRIDMIVAGAIAVGSINATVEKHGSIFETGDFISSDDQKIITNLERSIYESEDYTPH